MNYGGQNLKRQIGAIPGRRNAQDSPYAERYLQPVIPSAASREQESS
ncbi:MAG TPA: hypothetical protein VMW72_09030 [Sedimentisphaerales bacterium]|nr:hypothetical protein [Sedimentisphaerales bacterium]